MEDCKPSTVNSFCIELQQIGQGHNSLSQPVRVYETRVIVVRNFSPAVDAILVGKLAPFGSIPASSSSIIVIISPVMMNDRVKLQSSHDDDDDDD